MAVYFLVVGGTPSASGLMETGSGLAVDFAVAGRQGHSASIGNGTDTAIAVTHSLGTRDVNVQVYDNTTFETVIPDVVRTSTSVVTLTFATAPTTNQYRVVITIVRGN